MSRRLRQPRTSTLSPWLQGQRNVKDGVGTVGSGL